MSTMWIGVPDKCCGNWKSEVLPAPFFRREVKVGNCKKAEVRICGIGYFELWLNGEKVGDRLLDPVVSIYDKRVRFVRFDVTKLLKPGVNVFGVILGNGWYNCSSTEVWHFDKASWRDYPKFRMEFDVDGRTELVSDTSWKVLTDGPIRHDALREGETYDARKEPGDWLSPKFDASGWPFAAHVASPGGEMEEMTSPPCRALEVLPMTEVHEKLHIWACQENIAGHVRIAVRGKAGAQITLKHCELLNKTDGDFDLATGAFCKQRFQTDIYILKGKGVEVWEPRFTYHGFQYCKVGIEGKAELVKIEAVKVGTDFPRAGSFEAADFDVAKLMRMTEVSFQSNFVGIPTDCPHREKNGWTGDTQLACETGLFLFDAGPAYTTWLDTLTDPQRPSGQLSGIAPCAGWGYNWGSGPAWDAALFVIPDAIRRFGGGTAAIRKFYPNMCRYLDFCIDRSDDLVACFGLGDWCSPYRDEIPSSAVTDTGYFALFAELTAKCAEVLGEDEDAEMYSKLHDDIVAAFRKRFRKGPAKWGENTMVELAAAVYFGMTTAKETAAVCAELDKRLRADGCRFRFGILGAKYVPRVLADNGYVDTAYRIFTQDAYPGYVDWIRRGATTLWESFPGKSSRNHIMFGDTVAWFMTYPGGLRPDGDTLRIQPVIPAALGPFTARWHGAETAWDGKGKFTVTLPAGSAAEIVLPDGTVRTQRGGRRNYKIQVGK